MFAFDTYCVRYEQLIAIFCNLLLLPVSYDALSGKMLQAFPLIRYKILLIELNMSNRHGK